MGTDGLLSTISCCRYCSSPEIASFLSLGSHPPSDRFLRPEDASSEKKFPLEVCFCRNCSLVQLRHTVSPRFLFDDFIYLSSSSGALVRHYRTLTSQLSKRFSLAPGDMVLDIGCNDGIILNAYEQEGLTRVGVEPSAVGEIAKNTGSHVLKRYFDQSCAEDILKAFGPAKVVTATNVFPHIADINGFVRGIERLLRQDGVFVIEASYLLDVIDKRLFDTIYHEHLCYLSIHSVAPFLSSLGLQVFDAERVDFGASGPAIRIFAKKASFGPNQETSRVRRLLEEEDEWGIHSFERYQDYAGQVELVREQALSILEKLHSSGARIGGYGAPAKGNTLLNYLGINSSVVEFIAETNQMKIGMLTPGTHIPIISEEEFLQWSPNYALLLTWNYLDFFLERSQYIKNGGKFIVPLPNVRIEP